MRRRPSVVEDDAASSCSSSHSCLDEVPETSRRLIPYWPAYRDLLQREGYALDTFKDVKEFYHRHWEKGCHPADLLGYKRACQGTNENDLCKDAGLVRSPSCSREIEILILYSA